MDEALMWAEAVKIQAYWKKMLNDRPLMDRIEAQYRNAPPLGNARLDWFDGYYKRDPNAHLGAVEVS